MPARRCQRGARRAWLQCCLIVCLSTVVHSADSPRHPDAGQTRERELSHADRERTYRLHLPADMSTGTAVPLMIALHGLSMDGRSMEAVTGLNDVADAHHFAVAYPNGLGRMWRFWERSELGLRVRREAGYVDDVGFIEAMIDALVAEGTVDARRVYVTGLSNGAYMSNRLAISLSDRVAAIAPVAGTMSQALANLEPPKKMPVLYIHGTDDRIVGYDGIDGFTRRKSSLDAEEFVDWWCEHNGCDQDLPVESLDDVADDGCLVIRHVSTNDDQTPVVFYEVTRGGHTWPDGRFQPERFLGPVCRDFNASETIWRFCSQHALSESAGQP